MALQGEMSDILMSIEVRTFMRVFTEWKPLLRQCIEWRGDYLWAGRFVLLFLIFSNFASGERIYRTPYIYQQGTCADQLPSKAGILSPLVEPQYRKVDLGRWPFCRAFRRRLCIGRNDRDKSDGDIAYRSAKANDLMAHFGCLISIDCNLKVAETSALEGTGQLSMRTTAGVPANSSFLYGSSMSGIKIIARDCQQSATLTYGSRLSSNIRPNPFETL
jgi:hypothetical protein